MFGTMWNGYVSRRQVWILGSVFLLGCNAFVANTITQITINHKVLWFGICLGSCLAQPKSSFTHE